MTSKEALEILYRNCPMTVIREDDNISLYAQYLVEVITQDLERLEKLEKEYPELKAQTYKDYIQLLYNQSYLIAEVEKYKNSIELLKKYVGFKLVIDSVDGVRGINAKYDYSDISKKEYELLKEVLENE